jgi:hypothetical protein
MILRNKVARRTVLCFILLVIALSFFLVPDTRQPARVAQATGSATTTVENCVLTPEVLGGQGFTFSGLGFTFSGLGFTFSGLGFTFSGLGFTFSGLGIDPVLVAQEIQNNPISNQWLVDLQPGIVDGNGFNEVPTAVLIVDDFSTATSHGNQVLAVFNDLAGVVDLTNILLVPIDVSGPTGGYRTQAIEAQIRAAIDGPSAQFGPTGLIGQGYKHFVVNMSFGIIPCEDEGMMIGDVQIPPFSFDEGMQAIHAADDPKPLEPILICVKDLGGPGYHSSSHDYRAYFGYDNKNFQPVHVPIGSKNKFSPNPQDRGQARLFEPGRHEDVFSVKFNGNNLTWTLKGPDGISRSVTANRWSTPCTSVPPAPTGSVTPIAECVADLGGGHYRAFFGYNNANSSTPNIAIGGHNKVTPGPVDKGQPNTFLPGRHKKVFSVEFTGGYRTWEIKGPDGVRRSATATPSSPPCAQDEGFGLVQWFTQGLGVPEDAVDDYFTHLVSSVDDEAELDGLRGMFQEYLLRSATSDGEFAIFPVASSGNYRPWMGPVPLAPARWPELIGVGATLGNNGPQWQFSHDGNVLAPGAGYPIAANTYIAGTSFAAPFVSMVGALWMTYPDACVYDGVNPPLLPTALAKNTNATFAPGTFAPLNCAPPPDVVIDVCYANQLISYVPGKRKDGSPIRPERRNPLNALGAPQKDNTINYVSLGFGNKSTTGVIVLDFAPNTILNDGTTAPDIRVWESTDLHSPWWKYPEAVRVKASKDGITWYTIGQTTDNDQAYDLGPLDWARYIKLIEVSNKADRKFESYADGFDVDGIEAFTCAIAPEEVEIMGLASLSGASALVESDDARVSRSGPWSAVNTRQASGGGYLYSSGSDTDTLTLVFSGTAIDVIYVGHPDLGMFTVVIDDKAVQTISTSMGRATFGNRLTIRGLEPGVHTLKIVPISGAVAIDAFQIQ